MVNPRQRRAQIHRERRKKKEREKDRKGKPRPIEPTAPMRPAPVERGAELDTAAKEKLALPIYSRRLTERGFREMTLGELRSWSSVPRDDKERIRLEFKRGHQEPNTAIVVSRITGLSVDRIREIATS